MRPATATAAAVTATAAALSPCWIWRESQTDESHKCDEVSKKIESGHNPYLPSNVGARFRARHLSARTERSYLIRLYSHARRLHEIVADARLRWDVR